MSQLFAWGGQGTGASALASFLPKKSQGWSPSEWTGWTSLQSKVDCFKLLLCQLFWTTGLGGTLFVRAPFLESNSAWISELDLHEKLLWRKRLCRSFFFPSFKFWLSCIDDYEIRDFQIKLKLLNFQCCLKLIEYETASDVDFWNK